MPLAANGRASAKKLELFKRGTGLMAGIAARSISNGACRGPKSGLRLASGALSGRLWRQAFKQFEFFDKSEIICETILDCRRK